MDSVLQSTYEPRVAKLLEEIGSTPSGDFLIDWVRANRPKISHGQPISGDAFAYPSPLKKMVVKPGMSDDVERELIAHELVHMVKWSGHFVGSLEQEYDAYLTAAKIRSEFEGWDWRDPNSEAVKHYPEFFGPKANREEYIKKLRNRIPFYQVLPEAQPHSVGGTVSALAKQAFFGVKTSVGGTLASFRQKQKAKDPAADKAKKK